MVRKKLKKEIHQPDDRFFKVVMSEEGSAAQYLTTYHPELAELLDLSSLELQPDKFPIPDLKVFDADISYRCRFKNSEEQLMVSFLWENKSGPDEDTFIQAGLYLFFKSAMVAMANRHDFDLLFNKFSVIFDLDEKDHLIAIGHYVFGIYERLPEQLQEKIDKFDINIKSNIMTTLDILHERGRAEGIELAIKTKKLFDQGTSHQVISEQLKIDVQKVKEILKELG